MVVTHAESHGGLGSADGRAIGSGAGSEVLEQLDQQVREVVRRDGVDPQRDAGVVRRIAESVVGEHDRRSLTGAVLPVRDVDALVGELVARVSGFGPLQPFLDDPTVEEVWINDPWAVFGFGNPCADQACNNCYRRSAGRT